MRTENVVTMMPDFLSSEFGFQSLALFPRVIFIIVKPQALLKAFYFKRAREIQTEHKSIRHTETYIPEMMGLANQSYRVCHE